MAGRRVGLVMGLMLVAEVASAQDVTTLTARFHDLHTAGRYLEAAVLAAQRVDVVDRTPPSDPAVVAECLFDLGRTLVPLWRYDEAREHLERALTLVATLGPEDSLPRTRISIELALALIGLGRVREAEEILRGVVTRRERDPSPTPELARALVALGTLFRETQRFAEARSALERSLGLRESLLDPGHPDVAASLTALGSLHWVRGDYVDARNLYERARAVRDTPSARDHPDLATILNNLGAAYAELGRFADAIALHQRAFDIRRRSLGPTHYDVSVSLNNWGNMLRELGRLEEAEAKLNEALQVREQNVPPTSPMLTAILNNLALVYTATNRGFEVEALYLRILENLKSDPQAGLRGAGQIRGNLGRLYLSWRDYAGAEEVLSEAHAVSLEARGPMHHEVATILGFWGLAEAELGRLDDAIAHLVEALKIRERQLGPRHAHTGITLTRLGHVLGRAGRFDEGERRLRDGLAILEAELGAGHPDTVIALQQLGSLMLERGRTAEAYATLDRAATLAVALQSFDNERFRTIDHLGDWKLAFTELARAGLQLWSSTRDPAIRERVFQAAQIATNSVAGSALRQMSARFGSGMEPLARLVRETQDLSELRNATDRRFVEALGAATERRDQARIDGLRASLRDIDARIQGNAQRLRNDFRRYADLVRPAPLSFAEARRLLLDDEALVVFLAPQRAGENPGTGFVWAVTKTEIVWEPVDLDSVTLSARVQALRCGLDPTEWDGIGSPARCGRLLGLSSRPQRADQLPFHLGIAHELYRRLFGPVADVITDKHLLLVLSGPLTSLPFQVLVTHMPSRPLPPTAAEYGAVPWLGRRQPLTVLLAVSSLQALRPPRGSAAAKDYLGYGNPVLVGDGHCRRRSESSSCAPTPLASAGVRDLSERRSPSFEAVYRNGRAPSSLLDRVRAICPLPDTATELRCVAAGFGANADIRLGPEATEADIKRMNESGALTNYRLIHFATHGLLAGEAERLAARHAEPALVMTPPATPTDPSDDGLLSASEVAQLKLDAEWIILSACNTGGADGVGAEALSGLARAFFYAGARALLVSHWPVESPAAVRIVQSTFAELQADPALGRSEALKRAMSALIADPSRPFNAHPAAWAPFSVVGEGGPVLGAPAPR